MMAFHGGPWRRGRRSFRLSDTVLEEASVLFALAQVLLQKAKAEPLNDQSMLESSGG